MNPRSHARATLLSPGLSDRSSSDLLGYLSQRCVALHRISRNGKIFRRARGNLDVAIVRRPHSAESLLRRGTIDRRWNNVRPQEWIASRWSVREGTFGVSIPTGKPTSQRIPMGAGNHRCTLFVRDVNVFRIRPEGRDSPGPSVLSLLPPPPRQIAALPFILFHSPRTTQ